MKPLTGREIHVVVTCETNTIAERSTVGSSGMRFKTTIIEIVTARPMAYQRRRVRVRSIIGPQRKQYIDDESPRATTVLARSTERLIGGCVSTY